MGLNGAAPTRGNRDSSSGCLGEAASQSVLSRTKHSHPVFSSHRPTYQPTLLFKSFEMELKKKDKISPSKAYLIFLKRIASEHFLDAYLGGRSVGLISSIDSTQSFPACILLHRWSACTVRGSLATYATSCALSDAC